jgi:putative Mg2+ transporter-C (MgtC) family protein
MILPDHPTMDAALRIAAAVLLPLPLGWEREHRSRSAGLRTYPLLSVCLCGFLLIAQRAPPGPSEQADVFFGVLTGIGFVGSGAILKAHERGMATAVSLWVTGAIGVGLGYGNLAIAAAVSMMCALVLWTPWIVARTRGTS